ncbi:MAG: D-alanyl-D-alanine carboxypeptidase [Ruminococcus sp.]|uniref:D-alanyl-D-alanine carboxypeptidase family protein n=1 Tax=Ruminococcus sp. TaxID=41978 RepID=UPI0028738AFD|nr:D-alanyl-D-alanine carboxypeptidase family protein [Ruminococcus sp.]MBQ3285528.1 D-alanyl-D-alanine carboxypeptidase [Ruminococcus sp.]
MLKRIFAILLSVTLLFVSSLSVCALSEDDISSPSAVLMDAESGKILYEKNAHEQRACASITKVMTLTLVMEAVDSGKIHMDDVVTASAHAASMGGSDIWLEEGEQMTVDDMIKATAVASANDAAVALAEFISGSEDDFVAAMNEKAAQLGMGDTTFKNCNGLDEEGHITSAYDVALMSRELIRHEKIYDYTTIWLDNLRGGETQIVNTNKLLRSYDGITGLKTGTTGDAGSCISATAERDGLSLIAVVLGADSGKERFRDAAALLDYGFANYESKELSLNDDLSPLPVEGGMEDSVSISCEDTTSLTVPKGEGEGIEKTLDIPESITAPVKKGDVIGKLTFSLNEEELASFDVVADADVEEKSFGSIMKLLLYSMVKM